MPSAPDCGSPETHPGYWRREEAPQVQTGDCGSSADMLLPKIDGAALQEAPSLQADPGNRARFQDGPAIPSQCNFRATRSLQRLPG